MRFRRLRDISILARLGILTAFIAMAMGGNLWIARTNFARLSAALVAESLNSSMVIESASVERQLYKSWIALSSAAAEHAQGSTSGAVAISEFKGPSPAARVRSRA